MRPGIYAAPDTPSSLILSQHAPPKTSYYHTNIVVIAQCTTAGSNYNIPLVQLTCEARQPLNHSSCPTSILPHRRPAYASQSTPPLVLGPALVALSLRVNIVRDRFLSRLGRRAFTALVLHGPAA
ncbi:hypothetical protein A0H81_06865 [Grifola frondosa]|uniref:Uncharacterized protein n=1 Tax=Grifola frondosa TaxID=5627 RepID=A0A1C7MD39_GRIFR|nr:hypothetical protein A0H81_06865 [Grifola frondosa]